MTPQELDRQKIYRILTNNESTRRYEKTLNGFLVRLYRNMQSRVTGVQYLKRHLYQGKSLLARDVFYAWANSSELFHELFAKWESSGYERRLTPSVDRVNSALGYELGNMEWVEFHENCRRGALSKLRGLK